MEQAIHTIHGNSTGLKSAEKASLERIYRRRIPPTLLITPELARYICLLSLDIGRQIGVMVSRGGTVTHVIVGDAKGIVIPTLNEYPLGRRPLRGLRLIHTHLGGEPLDKDDLTDLSMLRLDAICALDASDELLGAVKVAHLGPDGVKRSTQDLHHPSSLFTELVSSLEDGIQRRRVIAQEEGRERAILISVSKRPGYEQEESLQELGELALSSDAVVVNTVFQRLKEINPKYLMGRGRLQELIIDALDSGATMLVFDQNLTPSQIREIGTLTELKVIDRTQLILDIFAKRAMSRDGKVQVELAQLKYLLPRLSGKGTAMSRLMGGIGGRGPGESKLEMDRRRVRDRISLLEKRLRELSSARVQRKQRRVGSGLPIVSIVGYTNAGKSTLLNALTKSSTYVENRLFATLDTATRRLRFPREREIIITDTVGFIKDLPKELMKAFKSTLEELGDTDLLLHVVDVSNPRFEAQMESVSKTLAELGLSQKKLLLVFNKADLLEKEVIKPHLRRHGAVGMSAINQDSLGPLLEEMERELFRGG